MSQPAADLIDLLAGIDASHPLAALRGQRPQARENAQASFYALLEPAAVGSFPLRERYAIATFVAALHDFPAAAAFYADLLEDEDPVLLAPLSQASRDAKATGPFGQYREVRLEAEGTEGVRWSANTDSFGRRLAAALTHAHLLVFRPREARPDDLKRLADAGWSADDVVTLSQLVAFLSFQLRLAWGIRTLAQVSQPATVSEGA